MHHETLRTTMHELLRESLPSDISYRITALPALPSFRRLKSHFPAGGASVLPEPGTYSIPLQPDSGSFPQPDRRVSPLSLFKVSLRIGVNNLQLLRTLFDQLCHIGQIHSGGSAAVVADAPEI